MKEKRKYHKRIEPGDRFGKLIAIEKVDNKTIKYKNTESTYSYWKCLCECGNTVIRSSRTLHDVRRRETKNGHSFYSCGCTRYRGNSRIRTKEPTEYEYIHVAVPKGFKHTLKLYASKQNKSLSDYVDELIYKDMEFDFQSRTQADEINNDSVYRDIDFDNIPDEIDLVDFLRYLDGGSK